MNDLLLALRQLRKHPGFTAVAVSMLALGIGANAVVFSVAKTILYRPLGVDDAEKLAWIRWILPETTGREDNLSWRDLGDLRAGLQSFHALALFYSGGVEWEHENKMEELSALNITPSLGEVLQIRPVIGRLLQEEDAEDAAFKVVMVSYELWQSRFGGDPAVLGQTIRLDQDLRTIVGVLPPGLEFPIERNRGNNLGSIVKGGVRAIWKPIRIEGPDRTSRGARMFDVIGRLKPGVTLRAAEAEVAGLSQRLAADYPESNRGGRFELVGLRDRLLGRTRQGIPVLGFAVAAVLVICCVNLANLLLARGATRQREIAVRLALGGSRQRIIRSMLLESLVLSVVGGCLGLGVAHASLRGIRALGSSSVPFIGEASVDGIVVAFTMGISVLTALMFGWLPAWRQSRVYPADALRSGVRSTGGREIRVWQRTLLTGQVAALVVLLAAAGLLLESFRRLITQDFGYQPQSVVMMEVNARGFKTNGDMCRMYRALRDRIMALPGVRAVGTMSSVPLTSKWTFSEKPKVLGEANALPESERPSVEASFVAFDYFQAMGIALIEGRFFRDSELKDDGYGQIVMLNESAAKRLFPDRSAVGGRFTVGSNPNRVLEVIGVVKDTRDVRLEDAPSPRFYWQYAFGGAQVVVRTDVPGPALIPMLRDAVQQTDARVSMGSVQSMAEIVSSSVAERKFLMSLLTGYAGLALGIAAIGIFGVVAYQVAQRTNEFGVRLALGATRGGLLRLVLGQAGQLALVGLAIGIPCSLAVNRLLTSQLFALSPYNPLLMAGTAAVLLLVALAASYFPARRAASVEPMEALRTE